MKFPELVSFVISFFRCITHKPYTLRQGQVALTLARGHNVQAHLSNCEICDCFHIFYRRNDPVEELSIGTRMGESL